MSGRPRRQIRRDDSVRRACAETSAERSRSVFAASPRRRRRRNARDGPSVAPGLGPRAEHTLHEPGPWLEGSGRASPGPASLPPAPVIRYRPAATTSRRLTVRPSEFEPESATLHSYGRIVQLDDERIDGMSPRNRAVFARSRSLTVSAWHGLPRRLLSKIAAAWGARILQICLCA